MDGRWAAPAYDSFKDVKIILHPWATIYHVVSGNYETEGTQAGNDSFDLTPFMSQGTQSLWECQVTLNWNLELFGPHQPRPNMVLEVQLWQSNSYKILWIGIIDSVSSVMMERGQRSMQLIARSREQQAIWKVTERVTPLYPPLTDLSYIARRVAGTVGLNSEEIIIPMSAYQTAHSNTQLAGMSAWDMEESLFLPMGFTPFIDCLGRLRGANRELQGREPDILLGEQAIIRASGSSQRPPSSRVRVLWLDPVLKKAEQQGRMLVPETISMGWFLPYIHRELFFSDDKTQRATGTKLTIKNSCNALVPFCTENWEQTIDGVYSENGGTLKITNYAWAPAIVALIISWYEAHHHPDIAPPFGGPVDPQGRMEEAIFQGLWCGLMMNVGTGAYEIWGTPFEWVHPRNITETTNKALPKHGDKPLEIETDFIVNEAHAQAVAIREIIYRTREASKWSMVLVDDPRVEFGDVVQFPDGNKMYVTDISRQLTRGSSPEMTVEGFLY